ncbi:MAG TPA: NADPH:quinone oxidoreductase family protein [Candidatus Sulfotelmatobacter sp.]|nr:NADPH:quinone oxidoreductase family protein [Candidatus Sulfotelmatobacter sp.]
MKAIQLNEYGGFESLRVVAVERPTPAANEVLIEVKAAGINFAELELTKGRYKIPKTPPFIMGFEAAGVVVEAGSAVKNLRPGDRVTSLASSGGFAEYATADAGMAIPIPTGVSFAEATTIPIQGVSAYCLLKRATAGGVPSSVLIQAAGGGVGLFLVQLAKIFGISQVIALASSDSKLELARSLGADVVFNYAERGWIDQVREATQGKGVELVLESASGEIGKESLKLTAPFGRIVMFGAKNVHDTLTPEIIQQLIYKNQTLTGFNIPSLPPQEIGEAVPALLELISQKRIRLFAQQAFPLDQARAAFAAVAGRKTIGKVVLIPGDPN